MPDQDNESPSGPAKKPDRPPYVTETRGLILLSVLVLIFLVIRYWNHIPWSAR